MNNKEKSFPVYSSCEPNAFDFVSPKENKYNDHMQAMLDATPLCATFWDETCSVFACNQEALNLFSFSSRQECLDNFHKVSPKYQPDGALSSEKSIQMVKKTFAEGKVKFSWLHQNLAGEAIPSKVTLVRVESNGTFIVAGYAQDLRALTLAVKEKNESNERVQIMLDATPLASNFWNAKFQNVDCNQEAVRLFDLSSKQEYLERFFDLSPEYQPDGELSADKVSRFMCQAFTEGSLKFEWMHQKLSGDLIPTEITLVRSKYAGEDIVLGYTKDLRKLKELIAEKDAADERNQIMLDTNPLCCNFWDENYQNIDCNQEAVRLFGLSSKQEYTERFFDLSPEYQPDGEPTAEKAAECIRKAFLEGYLKFE